MNARRSRIGLLLGISLVLLTGSWYWQGMDRTFPAPRLNLIGDYVQRQCRARGLAQPVAVGKDAAFHREIYLQDGCPAMLIFWDEGDSFQTRGPILAEFLDDGIYCLSAPGEQGTEVWAFLLEEYPLFSQADQVILTILDGAGLGMFVDHGADPARDIAFGICLELPPGKTQGDVALEIYDREGKLIHAIALPPEE